MRILHTLWTTEFGGVERLAIDLVEALSPSIQNGFLFGKARGRFIEKFHATGANIHSLDLCSAWDMRRRNRDNALSIMQNYDVIHMHAFNPVIASGAADSGLPVLFTDHGTHAKGRRLRIRDRVKRMLQQKFYTNHVRFMTFNSKRTFEVAKNLYHLGDMEMEVLYNGVNLSRAITPLPNHYSSLLDGRFVVGTTSRLVAFKRVDRLISAFSIFRRGKPDAVLLIVGDGAERARLENVAKENDLGDQVIFAGYQSDVTSFQNSSDVCVFPSSGEPFGLVAVETLALGKRTLVMADGGGIVEIIEPLSKEDVADSVEELADKLTDHYESEKTSTIADKSDSEQKRATYAMRFDIGIMASKFERIYGRILNIA